MDFTRFLSLKKVQKKYIDAGSNFGDAVSYLYLGECIGFEKLLDIWGKWEEHYASRGFRTVSLDRFIDYGGYGRPLGDVIGIRREMFEDPVFHAKIYRANFLGKIRSTINLGKLLDSGEPQFGVYQIPSTEFKKNN